MHFVKFKIDGFKDTVVLSSAIVEADLRKIRLLDPNTKLNEGSPPEFQFLVANGQLEEPVATADLQFGVSEFTFREKFIVMTNLKRPLFGLLFLQRNSKKLDVCQGNLKFPFFSVQLKHQDQSYSNVIEPILEPVETLLPPGKRTTKCVKLHIYTHNKETT